MHELPDDALADEVTCWRCGKLIAVTSIKCPICRAPARHAIAAEPQVSISADARQAATAKSGSRWFGGTDEQSLLTVLYIFLAFVGLSLIQRLITMLVLKDNVAVDEGALIRNLILGFELVDSLLVLVALAVVSRPARIEPARPWLGWVFGPFVLNLALITNLGYHMLIQRYLAIPPWMELDSSMNGAPLWWLVLAVCVQPAIFEELFFRYLTLGHLRTVTGPHSAVWVSSLIFGLAHLGVPLSMPVLILVGVALGYARIWSGSLILPMLLHAIHNAVVVYLEAQR